MKKYDVTISIVTYNNEDIIANTLEKLIKNIPDSLKCLLYIIDNNSNDNTMEILSKYKSYDNLSVLNLDKNIGFGSAHNKILNRINSKYHLIMNPDIIVDEKAIKKLYNYMEKNKTVGLISPKILNENGTLQYSCKRLPKIRYFIYRYFKNIIPNKLIKKELDYYTYKDKNHDKIFKPAIISGAFMFFRSKIFKKVGIFDEDYFLYFEDFDISLRVNEYYDVIYYPDSIVYHKWGQGHYKNIKLFFIFINSMLKFFWKNKKRLRQ